MSAGSVRRRGRALGLPDRHDLLGSDRVIIGATRHAGGRLWEAHRRHLDRWPRPGRDEADHACVLEAVARSLRSGQSLVGAIREGAAAEREREPGAALGRSARLAESGVGVLAVVDDWVGRQPSGPRLLAGTALAMGAEMGGAQGRCLDAAAASLRERASLEREVRALTSQARASAAVMVLAPLGFAVFSCATNPRVAQVLIATPLGWACVAGGLVLDGAGAGWMARLARRVR